MRQLARFALVAKFVLLTNCGDYEIALPNGYKLARTSSGVFVVVNQSNRVVTPESNNGLRAAVVGDLVVGEIDYAEPRNAARFFIVNTRTNASWSNLTAEEYGRQLRTLGIHHIPVLHAVTRFTTTKLLRTAGEVGPQPNCCVSRRCSYPGD